MGISSVAAAALSSVPVARKSLKAWLGKTVTDNLWKLAAVVFVLINVKNVPGVWHVSLFKYRLLLSILSHFARLTDHGGMS